MNRRKSIPALLALAAAPAAMLAATEPTALAKAAAKGWLKKIDSSSYRASWQTAAALFKAAISAEAWQQTAQTARAPLGEIRSRTESAAAFTKSLPGAPDGQYVVIQFNSKFEKKANATETVTVAQDQDGVWRVAGYFIQ